MDFEELDKVENEGQAVVNEDVNQLVVELERLAEGGDSVKFGTLFKDERCEQIFEAIVGTLKAAKKRGLIDFKGEVLLQGSHDDVDIKIIKGGASAEEPEEKPAEEEAAETADPPAETADPPAETADPPAETAEAAPEEQEAPESPAKAEKEPEASEETPEEPEEPAVQHPPVPPPVEASSPEVKEKEADVPKLRSTPTPQGVTEPRGEQDTDGKWKVETSYIDHRTADPNRRESRRSSAGESESTVVSASTTKDNDGKWKVNTGYINYRTKEVANLEGRKNSVPIGDGTVPVASQRTDDGKWKVDTSYIDYRTGDTANMTRKQEEENQVQYEDPASKKYPLDALQGAGNKPPGVDPSKKEQYLSDSEFQSTFGMSPAEFAKMPKWKQTNKKKEKGLF